MIDTIAILTGASRGIGAGLARGLCRAGTRLVTLSRRVNPELGELASLNGAELEQIQVDLSDLHAVEQTAERLFKALPRTAKRYVLINNAGTVEPVAMTSALTNGTAINTAFALNVSAVIALTARFVATVQDISADRRVLNISSGAGRNPNAGWGVYCATKAALDMYTRVLNLEQGDKGIRAVALAPGIVDTDMQEIIRASDPAHFPALTKFQEFHATGKLADPTEVATRILAYLDRNDFGNTEIDDIRNYY